MRRAWSWLLLVVLVAVTLHPLLTYGRGEKSAHGPEPMTISRYDSVYELETDGDALVTETVTVVVPEGEASGVVLRHFDEVDDHDWRARRVPEVSRVTRDGREVPWHWREVRGGRVKALVIGEEGAALEAGAHTYVVQFSLSGLFVAGDDGAAALRWDVVPGDRRQPVATARATLRLPTETAGLGCRVGNGPDAQGCTSKGEGSSTVVLTASDLAASDALEVTVSLPGVSPSTHLPPWSPRLARVLGSQWWYAALVALGILYAGWLGRRLGRVSQERAPAEVVQQTPPSGVGPAVAAAVAGSVVGSAAGTDLAPRVLVAELLEAARRGELSLTWGDDGWRVSRGAVETDDDALVALLPTPPEAVALGTAEAGRFVRDAQAWVAAAQPRALQAGLLEKAGPGRLGAFGVVAAFAAFVVLVLLGTPSTALALVPGTYAVFALPLLAGAGRPQVARTDAGMRIWAASDGFARTLHGGPGEAAFDFSDREETFEEYLPWAVARGDEAVWADQFRRSTGRAAPVPSYLSGAAHHFATGAEAIADLVGAFV